MEDINSVVAQHSIVVFSGDGCPYCVQAVEALKSAGHSPHVVKASWEQREALFDITSSRSIPNVWVKGKYVGGCNDGPESWMGIKKLINNNKLSELLR